MSEEKKGRNYWAVSAMARWTDFLDQRSDIVESAIGLDGCIGFLPVFEDEHEAGAFAELLAEQSGSSIYVLEIQGGKVETNIRNLH